MTDSVEALRDIRSRIELAAKGAGRDPQTVTLVAVSKTYGEEAIVPVIDNGQRAFGENRVQEAKAKWPNLKARFPRPRTPPHRPAPVKQDSGSGGTV